MTAFKELKQHRGLVFLVYLLTLGNTIGELLLPKFMSQIIDVGVAQENISYIFKMGLIMLSVTFLTILVRGAAAYFSAKTTMRFSRDLRQRLFDKVNHMTFDETEHFGISSLITRVTNDVAQVENLVLMGLRPLARAPLTFIGGMVMAFITNARLTLVIIACLPILAVMIYVMIHIVIPYFPKLQRSLDRINLLLRQRLTGLRVIRAFSRDKKEEETFEEANETYYQTGLKVNQLMQTINPLLVLVLNLAIVVTLMIGSRFVNLKIMNIGALMAFIQYVTQVLSSLMTMTRMTTILPRTSASIERIDEVLEYPSRQVGGKLSLEEPITEIQANHLSFSYPGAQIPALKDLNFSIKKGETLGIIGGTGSGKTTLLKLFLQFYDPTDGELLLNNQSIAKLDTKSVREKISYVPQQNYFFSDSLRGNLTYSNLTASDERMLDSLETAQASDFLPKEKPLDERVSRGGQNYSGGQRQRLAISRGLTREASVYIFDDSFSALDYKTDLRLRQSLKGKLGEAITIIVAQRVATIRHADKILVLENGQIQGFATHKELMKTNKVYQEIAISQGEEDSHD